MKSPFYKSLACVLLVLFFADTLKAQEKRDYVIKTTGDTVYCDVSASMFGKNMFYKSFQMASKEKIDPETIKQYTITHQKERFVAIPVEEGEPLQYLKVIEEGGISLYQQTFKYTTAGSYDGLTGAYTGATTSETDDWYITKDGVKFEPLKTSSFKMTKTKPERIELFKNMISDKPRILVRFKADNSFSFDKLQYIIHLYNTGKELSNY